MPFFSFFSFEKSKIILGVVLLLFLGFATRFYHLAEPKAVVFDEFHFFHFVTEYEKGNYFFDIHPPLGKLILWGNAKMYGLEEYVENIKTEEAKKDDFEKAMRLAKDAYLNAQKNGEDEQVLSLAKAQYEDIEKQKSDLDAKKIESYDIGKEYSKTLNMFGIRSISALFGALLVPLLFLFSVLITQNYALSVLVGIIAAFDSVLITESQYVLMDSMLLFAMVASVFFTTLYAKNPSFKWWIWVAVFSAFAVSIKWTGISVIAAAGVVWIWKMIEQKNWKTSFLYAGFYWTVVCFLYIFSFWVHFVLLPHSGEGDAFHTPEFRKNLENSSDYANESVVPMRFFGQFIELNIQMGERSAGIRNEHPFASRPEDWINGEKSIYYWAGTPNIAPSGLIDTAWNATLGTFFQKTLSCNLKNPSWQQQIHLFPNPVFWKIFFFSSFLASAIILFEAIQWFIASKTNTQKISEMSILITAFVLLSAINILPFILIDRPQFLYHALGWATFSLLMFACILSYILAYFPKWISWILIGIVAGGALVFFTIEMPLIYGFSFPDCVGKVLFGGF